MGRQWTAGLLVGSWLTVAGASLLLAVADSSQDLYHPAVLVTARYAVGAWFAACILMLRLRPQEWERGSRRVRIAQLTWAVGAAMHAVHVLFAFALAHGWSHGHAFRRVEEVGGFGEGIFVSHAFLVVWVADAVWWCVNPSGYARRPAWVRRTVYGFLAFIVFNSTVVYGPPPTRIVCAVLFGVLLVLVWRRGK